MARELILTGDKEKDTISFIKKFIWEDAKNWKFLYSGNNQSGWIDDILWYKGNQWPENYPKNKSSVFFNRLFSSIQKELPFMTDRKPRIYIMSTEPGDEVIAEILENIIETGWINRGMQTKLPEAVLHAKQLGTSFLRPFWNDKLLNGGDFDCEVVDPLEVFPFAETKNLEDSEGVIRARWVSLGWIRRNFPKSGWRVNADKTEINAVPVRSKETNRSSGYKISQVTDTTAAETNYLNSRGGQQTDFDRVLLYELFLKDGDLEYFIATEETKGKKKKKNDEEYPNGRRILFANNIILEDEPFAWDEWPGLIEIVNYKNSGEFWAMSDIQQIKQGQKTLNKIHAMLIDASNRGIYTIKFVRTGSGIDVDNFVVSSDAVYESQLDNPVSELVPQALQPQLFQYADAIENAIMKTAGTTEFTPPTNGELPSGRAMAAFQDITTARLRLKIRNMEEAIRKLGKAWLEMIVKNYTERRIMRIRNRVTNAQEYVFVFREEDPEKAQVVKELISQQVVEGSEQIDPATQQPIPGSGTPKYKHIVNMAEIKGELDLTVATDSTVSVSKVATYEQASQLFQMQAIDQQALLEAAEYPKRESILERMGQASQAAAQAQAQQDQQAVQALSQTEIGKEKIKASAKLEESEGDNQTTILKTELDNDSREKIAALKEAMKDNKEVKK